MLPALVLARAAVADPPAVPIRPPKIILVSTAEKRAAPAAAPAPPVPGTPPRAGTVMPVFDYTHPDREGTDLFAGVAAAELAHAVRAMRALLIP